MKDKASHEEKIEGKGESDTPWNFQTPILVKESLSKNSNAVSNNQSKIGKQGIGKQKATCDRIKELLDIVLVRIRATEGLTGNAIKKDQLVLIVKDVIESNCQASIKIVEVKRQGGLRHNQSLKRLIDVFTALLWKEKSVTAKALSDIEIPDDVVNNVSKAIPLFAAPEGVKDIVLESSDFPYSDVGDKTLLSYDMTGSIIGVEYTIEELKDVLNKVKSSCDEDIELTSNSSRESSSFESYEEELTTAQILIEEMMSLFQINNADSWEDQRSQENCESTLSVDQELSYDSQITSKHDELSLLSEDYNFLPRSHGNETMLSKFFGNSSECSSVHEVDEDELEDEIKGDYGDAPAEQIMIFNCARCHDGESSTSKYNDSNPANSVSLFPCNVFTKNNRIPEPIGQNAQGTKIDAQTPIQDTKDYAHLNFGYGSNVFCSVNLLDNNLSSTMDDSDVVTPDGGITPDNKPTQMEPMEDNDSLNNSQIFCSVSLVDKRFVSEIAKTDGLTYIITTYVEEPQGNESHFQDKAQPLVTLDDKNDSTELAWDRLEVLQDNLNFLNEKPESSVCGQVPRHQQFSWQSKNDLLKRICFFKETNEFKSASSCFSRESNDVPNGNLDRSITLLTQEKNINFSFSESSKEINSDGMITPERISLLKGKDLKQQISERENGDVRKYDLRSRKLSWNARNIILRHAMNERKLDKDEHESKKESLEADDIDLIQGQDDRTILSTKNERTKINEPTEQNTLVNQACNTVISLSGEIYFPCIEIPESKRETKGKNKDSNNSSSIALEELEMTFEEMRKSLETSITPKSVIGISLPKDADEKEYQVAKDEIKLINEFDGAQPEIQKDQGYGEKNLKLSILAGKLDIPNTMQVSRRKSNGLRLWKKRQSNIRVKLKDSNQVEARSTDQRLINSTRIQIVTNHDQDLVAKHILNDSNESLELDDYESTAKVNQNSVDCSSDPSGISFTLEDYERIAIPTSINSCDDDSHQEVEGNVKLIDSTSVPKGSHEIYVTTHLHIDRIKHNHSIEDKTRRNDVKDLSNEKQESKNVENFEGTPVISNVKRKNGVSEAWQENHKNSTLTMPTYTSPSHWESFKDNQFDGQLYFDMKPRAQKSIELSTVRHLNFEANPSQTIDLDKKHDTLNLKTSHTVSTVRELEIKKLEHPGKYTNISSMTKTKSLTEETKQMNGNRPEKRTSAKASPQFYPNQFGTQQMQQWEFFLPEECTPHRFMDKSKGDRKSYKTASLKSKEMNHLGKTSPSSIVDNLALDDFEYTHFQQPFVNDNRFDVDSSFPPF